MSTPANVLDPQPAAAARATGAPAAPGGALATARAQLFRIADRLVQERICRGWVRQLARNVGATQDVPAPDMMTSPQHMLVPAEGWV